MAAKTADKPKTTAGASNGQDPQPHPSGRSVSLLGIVRAADLRFRDGDSYSFDVDGLLAASMEFDPNEDMEGLQEGQLVDAAALGRAHMRMYDPDNPKGKLSLREFLRAMVPGCDIHLTPDYAAMETDKGTLLEAGHPFESA